MNNIKRIIEILLDKKYTIERELKEISTPESKTALILTARRDTIQDVIDTLMEVYEINEEQ